VETNNDINVIEWAGKLAGVVGAMTLVAYVAGYAKYYMLYRAIDCQWVLSFHSFQDFTLKGALDVLICLLFSLPIFFIYGNSVDADNKGRRAVGAFVVISVVGLCLAEFLNFKLGYEITDLLIYAAGYALLGVLAAAQVHDAIEQKTYRYLWGIFVIFAMNSFFSNYLIYDVRKFIDLDKQGRFQYIYDKDGESSALISSVAGKYLIVSCRDHRSFRIVEPSESWWVSPGSPEACK